MVILIIADCGRQMADNLLTIQKGSLRKTRRLRLLLHSPFSLAAVIQNGGISNGSIAIQVKEKTRVEKTDLLLQIALLHHILVYDLDGNLAPIVGVACQLNLGKRTFADNPDKLVLAYKPHSRPNKTKQNRQYSAIVEVGREASRERFQIYGGLQQEEDDVMIWPVGATRRMAAMGEI